VFDSNLVEYSNFESVPRHLHAQICREMFPGPNAEYQNLDYCMRFLPHHNDDGGFFVAVLRKTCHLDRELKNKEEAERKKLQKMQFVNKQQVL
jgi:tRNA (cytosine34-C5)-methyltransferase